MKFTRLYLKAFGTFRDRVIELPTGAGKDFHVIFGPNEAGKSTILRAVTGFLFGIPERTGDAFLHDYNALRVGATLLLADGTRLSAMRRKARKATLFSIDDTTGAEITDRPLPESTAVDLVGGLDLALYQNLFGLDLNGLVSGSEELLRGEGEVGRSLFQAAAGLASLRTVMADLDEEATEIFKARGSTGRLNRALNEFDEQRRLLKEATVRTYVWETVERECRQAEVNLAQLRGALKDKRAGQQRLQRIRANLPLLAERAAKQEEAEALSHIPSLPLEMAQLRVAAQERLRNAEEARRMADSRLSQFKVDAAALVVREGILQQASSIEQVFHAIDGYRVARDSLPRLARERADLSERIRQLLVEIGSSCDVSQAADLLPSETLAARVQSLIEDYGRLTDREEQLDAQIRTKQAAIDRLKDRLASLPESARVDELETSATSVANLADLEARRRKLDREIVDEDGRLHREAATLWPGSLSELVMLTVPLAEMAGSFENELAVLAQDERLVSETEATLSRDLEDRRRELNVLAAAGEVVTQTEVSAARKERDDQWTELRRIHIGGIPQSTSKETDGTSRLELAAGFEAAIREADRLADLLRADTERATNLEATRQRIADMHVEVQRNEERRDLIARKRQVVQDRWEVLIAPLRRSDLSPAALREWLSCHHRLVERYGNLERLRTEWTLVDGDINRGCNLLHRALLACGLAALTADESATDMLARAQKAINAARKATTDRESASDQIQSGMAELRDLQELHEQVAVKIADWKRKWAETTEGLRLTTEALPAEARARLDQFSQLSSALDKLRNIDADASEHRAAVTEFDAKVSDIARVVTEPLEVAGSDAVAERFYAALADTRRTDAKRQQMANDIARETRVISEADVAAEQARNALDALIRRAGSKTAEELPEVEGKAARKQSLQQRLHEIDEQLVQQNAQAVGEVLQEAGALTLENVIGQIADGETEIEDLEGQVEAAQGNLFSAKQRLGAIDGGMAAADAQQIARSLAARIAKEAHAYARTRLASAILNRTVQLYREQHQGPLLHRAAEVFARITLGSFSGLTVDYEDDRQVLLGVRPDTKRVPVAGMSQGTRDQLFLSLRLAAIEQHIHVRGPFPVIVDDLLVQFDDDRAVATLDVLSELSAKTQVLFFTHHRHLVDLAEVSRLGIAISVQNL
ncbi:MAG: AAA family ATPase [Betaproteobacteria bacterium]|nr:AAA family ATPase [Betaproteobacteria bacterium]